MSWETPVQNYQGPPLPNAKTGMVKGQPQNPASWGIDPAKETFSGGLENVWKSLFPWLFPGEELRPPAPMQKGKPQPPPQTAPTGPLDAARKGLGIDPASWQTFIRQTGADWGIYAGLGILGLVGLVFLVSAAGGGNINRPLSPYSAPQRIRRSLTGGGGGRKIGTMKK